MSLVRASAAAVAGCVFALLLSGLAPSPAVAGPRAAALADLAPPTAAVVHVQGFADEDYEVRPRARYGRRAYVDRYDEDGYYDDLPRRAPGVRSRYGQREYDEVAPRRVYRNDGRVRRYYDEDRDYEYESVDPDIGRSSRRYAGPPSGLGAGPEARIGRRTVDPKFARTTVRYNGSEPANSIVINTRERYLYLVQGDGTAIRYGVGVGKEGFTWKGVNKISAKREWPDWYPPAEMRARRPELPQMMAGGPENPLGARALYLGNTLYRIHGSNEPWTIGHAVSSGCIRMTNDDVTDLYGRVNIGTSVKVM